MPVYNGERFLAEAIDSIRGQTFTDFEFVIVDDGSTDASPAILADYASRDPRIRVLRQANAGIVAALNRGLSDCGAPLVARMDADDISLPPRLERQRAFLEAHPRVAVVGSSYRLMSDAGAAGPTVRQPAATSAITKSLRHGNCLAHPTAMMRRDVIVEIGGYRDFFRHAEDYDLWTRVAERHEIANLPDCLLKYRVHGGQISWAAAEAQVIGTLAVQGFARARREYGSEPAPLPHAPDREFLRRVLNVSTDVDYSITASIANRMDLCRSVGMAEDATLAREAAKAAIASRHGHMTRRTIAGILAWQDLRAALRARKFVTATWAFVCCGLAVLTDLTLMRAAVRRWGRSGA